MTARRIVKIALWAVAALLLAVLCYVAYVLLSYDRIPDNIPLEPQNTGKDEALRLNVPYRAVTQNVGFGAYTADFTFFMDGGKESRAESRESVLSCIRSAADEAKALDPDFILFQEVDLDATRSFHVDQRALLEECFPPYSSTFAINYHSAYLMYPIFEPHGASDSGLLTLSRYNASSALRRSLPISTSLSKLLDLDRCYSVTRYPVENGKELVIYNVHLSAYGSSDEIRTAQMTMLFEDMKAEYEKGNYCVCGGDFNHDFTGDSTQRLNGGSSVDFGWAQPFPAELLPAGIRRCMDYKALTPTCRNCDIPYKQGNFTIIVDGFLVSENVEVKTVENISCDFSFSDHNPVVLEFICK